MDKLRSLGKSDSAVPKPTQKDVDAVIETVFGQKPELTEQWMLFIVCVINLIIGVVGFCWGLANVGGVCATFAKVWAIVSVLTQALVAASAGVVHFYFTREKLTLTGGESSHVQQFLVAFLRNRHVRIVGGFAVWVVISVIIGIVVAAKYSDPCASAAVGHLVMFIIDVALVVAFIGYTWHRAEGLPAAPVPVAGGPTPAAANGKSGGTTAVNIPPTQPAGKGKK